MSEYTAEEYRYVLNKIYNMNSEEREKAFGEDEFVADYVEHRSAQELIEKYRAYVNTPKTGEYWKRKGDGEMVVVRYVKDCMVIVYYCDGGFGCEHSLTYFIDYFVRTEHKSRYLADFLNEMKEVSGTK